MFSIFDGELLGFQIELIFDDIPKEANNAQSVYKEKDTFSNMLTSSSNMLALPKCCGEDAYGSWKGVNNAKDNQLYKLDMCYALIAILSYSEYEIHANN